MIVTIIIVSQTELHKPGNKMQTMQSSRIKLTNISNKVTTFLKCNKVAMTEANVVLVWIQARPTLKKKKLGHHVRGQTGTLLDVKSSMLIMLR